FFQAEDGIRDFHVTGVQTCALPILLYVLGTAVIKLPSEDRDRIFAAMFLILGSILFWALFEQAGSSLNLFTDRHVNRSIFGWERSEERRVGKECRGGRWAEC